MINQSLETRIESRETQFTFRKRVVSYSRALLLRLVSIWSLWSLRSLAKTFSKSLWLCGNHFLAIVTNTAIVWKPAYVETAQQSKSQRPLNFLGSDRSDHMETSLYRKYHKSIQFISFLSCSSAKANMLIGCWESIFAIKMAKVDHLQNDCTLFIFVFKKCPK